MSRERENYWVSSLLFFIITYINYEKKGQKPKIYGKKE
jgi:hypothetical protein